jgi:basic membrane protein A and related proteins
MKRFKLVLLSMILVGMALPGCLPKSFNCKQPEVFCVGLVTDGGRITDHAYNQAAWEGLQQAKTAGFADWVASIETVDARDYQVNIRDLAQAGYDVIVTVGAGMGDATRTEAAAFPEAYFIGIDQDQSSSQEFNANLVGLVFREDEIGYLAGALAASLTKTGNIGAILGSDVSLPMQRYGLGFSAGAASIDPNVVATVLYHNEVGIDKSTNDPEWGAAQANALVDQNTDIIFGGGGSTGSNAILAAVMRGAYAIGSDTDEYYTLPVAAPHLYTSVVKLISPALAALIEAARNAQEQVAGFPSGNFTGQVGLAPYHDLDASIPDELKARMTQLTQDLLSGDTQTGVP